jgi:hypothetical protein
MSSIKDILPKTEKDIIKFDPSRLRERLKGVAFSGSAEEHWKKNYKEFSDELKIKQNKIRRGEYFDTQADRDARKFKENARKAGKKYTKSDEKDVKLILHSLTKGKMKELREKYIKEKKLDIKEKKPVNAYFWDRDFGFLKARKDAKSGINSILQGSKTALKTVSEQSKGNWLGISGNKSKPAGFAGSEKFIGGDATAADQYGNKSVAGIGQINMQKLPGADHLNNLPDKPGDYHAPIKLVR